MSQRIVIAAGGTGGHVFPALAVAQALQQRDWQIAWIGSAERMEAKLVPAAGFEFHPIRVRGLRGKRLSLLAAPAMLVIALWQALVLLRRLRPVVVLGMGGFASGPVGMAAWLLRIPLVIHEQNAVAGTTNRWLAKLASRVCVAYAGAFKSAIKTEQVGNPLRAGIEVTAANYRYEGPRQPLQVLVLGGSLGAQVINQRVVEALAVLDKSQRPAIVHQAGKLHIDQVKAAYEQYQLDGVVQPFIEDMAAAYQWADVVIARAGALTLAELSAMGLPSLLIPLPTAIDDHQTANAQALVKCGGAVLCPQAEFSIDKLLGYWKAWQRSPQQLNTMARQARDPAQLRATTAVCEQVIDVVQALS